MAIPEDDGRLQRVQQLQFSDRARAEELMLQIAREVYAVDVAQVELTPSPISLNSIHGFLTHADGRRYFFKTHTESDTVIAEYYRARQIADAGYPIIQPIFRSNRVGKQLLVYERIDDPAVFDAAWAIEKGHPLATASFESLRQAQEREDRALFQRYLASLHWQDAETAARAPVHQLFHHRLTGGRYERFYGAETEIQLPGINMPIGHLLSMRWHINGQEYDGTLANVVAHCLRLLNPEQTGPAIVGHGDAHNGNVFLQPEPMPHLLYFDPAFAGSHHPLLDLAKPIFHNVFAMWMYFPYEMRERLRVQLRLKGEMLIVSYENQLPAIREMFFRSKLEQVLLPTLQELKQRSWLAENWRGYFKAALACCPLLTLNLADPTRFPAEITLLGLAMTMEMGAVSGAIRSTLDEALEQIAAVI